METNAQVLAGNIWHETGFVPGRVVVRGATIADVVYDDTPTDGSHLPYITPGLIDIQINGALGDDFTQNRGLVGRVAEALPRWGVTGFVPTLITAPPDTYQNALANIRHYVQTEGAAVLGVHIEGPDIDPAHRGAHELAHIRPPSLPDMEALFADGLAGPERSFIHTLAPELPGALDVIRFLTQHGAVVSVGHSGATYAEGLAAFDAGARCATHLFNAMPPLHHRQPGLVGAVLAHPDATANIIADGIHLHPAIVSLIYGAKGWQQVILVTDAMAGMGMPPGRYELAGQMVVVDDTSATVAGTSTLAGSILTLDAAIRNMVAFSHCPLHEAVAMATYNPARLLGRDHTHGRIAPGYAADLALFDSAFRPRQTIIGGVTRFRADG